MAVTLDSPLLLLNGVVRHEVRHSATAHQNPT